MATYELAEGQYLMAVAAEARRRDIAGRIKSGQDLLNALEAAAVGSSFVAERDTSIPERIWLAPDRDPNGGRWVAIDTTNGTPFITGKTNAAPVPGLSYNPLTKRWEGDAWDDSMVPIPGQARVRRSAVAVVVEHVLRLIGNRS